MESTKQVIGSVFIDFDNVLVALMNIFKQSRPEAQSMTLSIIGRIDSFLEKRGVQTIKRRAYCDWSQYPDAMGELYNMGVKPEFIKGIPGKNSADMELSLSVQDDLLRRPEIEALTVVAGDRDYMPIANRVKELNKALFIVSFRESLSGDLKRLVGSDSVFYINPMTGEIMGSDWQPTEEPKIMSKDVQKVERIAGLSDNEVLALRAAIREFDQAKPVWTTARVSIFLVTSLANTLNQLPHEERKEVFNRLVARGYLKTHLLHDYANVPYAGFSVNEDSDVVKRVRKWMIETPAPG